MKGELINKYFISTFKLALVKLFLISYSFLEPHKNAKNVVNQLKIHTIRFSIVMMLSKLVKLNLNFYDLNFYFSSFLFLSSFLLLCVR